MASITLNGVTAWFIASATSPNSYQVHLIIGVLNAFLAAGIVPKAFEITWAGPPSTVAISTLGNLKVEAYSPEGYAGFSAEELARYSENKRDCEARIKVYTDYKKAEQERKDSGVRGLPPPPPPGFHVWQQYVEKQAAKPKRGSGAGGKAGVGALRR